MELSLRPIQTQSLRQTQLFYSYETSGDLELLSLHRIKNRMHTLQVHPQVRSKLVGELVKENAEYREGVKRNWYCVTPLSLNNAVERTKEYLTEQTELSLQTISDYGLRQIFTKKLSEKVGEQEAIMKGWFLNNYNNILYNVGGKIPYPIVRKMRDQLSQWALEGIMPFLKPIEELIDETAISCGLNPKEYESAQDLWKALRKVKS